MNGNMLKFLSLLAILGFTFSVIGLSYKIYQRFRPLAAGTYAFSAQNVNVANYDAILFPSLNKRLPITSVSPAENKPLPLSSTSAVMPVGARVIYAHNWPNLFASLHNLKLSDQVNLIKGDQSEVYKVINISSVNPFQTDVLHGIRNDQYILYTCTGFLDTRRLVVLVEKV